MPPKRPPKAAGPTARDAHALGWAVALTVLLTVAVYGGSLSGGFTNWDDPQYVTLNAAVRTPSLAGVLSFFTTPFVGSYVPLTMLSLTLDHALFGPDPHAFRAVNLTLHALAAALLAWLVFLLQHAAWPGLAGWRAAAGPLLTGALFGVHPLHAESVAWIAERKDVLSAAFFFGTLVAFVLWRAGGGRRAYTVALACATLSLLAKGMGVSLPFVLLALAWYQDGTVDRRTGRSLAPFFALAALFALVTFAAQKASGLVAMHGGLPAWHYLLVACRGFVFYPAKLLVPSGLSAYYPYPPAGTLPWDYLLAPAAAAALVAALWWSRRFGRELACGGFIYAISVLPVLQLVPIGHAVAADRYAYIPSAGWLLASGLLLARALADGARTAQPALAAGVLALAVYAPLGALRAPVFASSLSLWSATAEAAPSALAFNMLGRTLLDLGEREKARPALDRALAIDPTFVEALINRSSLRIDAGDTDGAGADCLRALEREPRSAAALNNCGLVDAARGRQREAAARYEAAVAADPAHLPAWFNLGVAREKLGQFAAAAEAYTHVVQLDPSDAETLFKRAIAWYRAGERDRAIADVRALQARGEKPDPDFLRTLGVP